MPKKIVFIGTFIKVIRLFKEERVLLVEFFLKKLVCYDLQQLFDPQRTFPKKVQKYNRFFAKDTKYNQKIINTFFGTCFCKVCDNASKARYGL